MHEPEGPDADQSDGPADVTGPDGPRPRSRADADAIAPVPDVSAEDEIAEAEARAAAARDRLARLRAAAEAGEGHDDTASHDGERRPAKSIRARLRAPRRPRRPGWLRRPRRRTIAAGVGVALASASLAASGYMVSLHHTTVHKQQLAVEFAAAARQGVTALMSIDPAHAKRDVQRMIDASTGDLNSQLSAMSLLMVKKAEDTKVGSTVTVEAVAVESVSDTSGVVLVAAKTVAIGPDNAKPPPALFRLSVNMDRERGQLKMSKVDFLQ
ncbi:hypothetical protein ACKUT9_16420 [Mycobacterium seoulense]|uniref:Mce-associated membrane protein n=1 Tax=Mycobacterium seoulense TaxID=386911 RepID=A0A7I7P280_9MYCO|nr:hypothetical protein [Mycobacterium seoulense]BBY02640.1 hypothetical protein MSEO_31390 [Mycobacterium seoulense]